MPLLDIDRVVQLEGRTSFKQNIKADYEDQSLASESIMKSTAKGEDQGHFISKTSASFLNDSNSKQIVSVQEGDELKPTLTQSDAINIDN